MMLRLPSFLRGEFDVRRSVNALSGSGSVFLFLLRQNICGCFFTNRQALALSASLRQETQKKENTTRHNKAD